MARFCAAYPGLYVSLAWPTRDRIIPWALFEALYRELDHVVALDRLVGAEGVVGGIAMAMDKTRGKRIAKDLTRAAFPELGGGA